jgi:hypothetical protein
MLALLLAATADAPRQIHLVPLLIVRNRDRHLVGKSHVLEVPKVFAIPAVPKVGTGASSAHIIDIVPNLGGNVGRHGNDCVGGHLGAHVLDVLQMLARSAAKLKVRATAGMLSHVYLVHAGRGKGGNEDSHGCVCVRVYIPYYQELLENHFS